MEESKRRYFRDWVLSEPDPNWPQLPLTHITKGVYAQDIVMGGALEPQSCSIMDAAVTYFFYGRAAYRAAGDGAIKFEAACPFCFVFDPRLIQKARKIYPFDTGAFHRRMYSNKLMDEMKIDDFSISGSESLPNQLIKKVFGDSRNYFSADLSKIRPADDISQPGDLHARAYLELIGSRGRNEADDRICSIEIILDQRVDLDRNLQAVIVPHTLWNSKTKTSWLEPLEDLGVTILVYEYIPGKNPDHYQALLEGALKNYLHDQKMI